MMDGIAAPLATNALRSCFQNFHVHHGSIRYTTHANSYSTVVDIFSKNTFLAYIKWHDMTWHGMT